MAGLDKLEWLVGGRPLLSYTLDALAASDLIETIVVVASVARRAEWSRASWLPAKVGAVVVGGTRRQDSVVAGMAVLGSLVPDPTGERVVLVHDGARPVISPSLIKAVIMATDRFGAAIPVVPVVETVKRMDGDLVAGTVDRDTLGIAQTPQGIRRSIWGAPSVQAALATGTWTDEAALLEACTITVHAVPGESTNLKVTVPDDLPRVAASLTGITSPSVAARTGIGHDSHPFGAGQPLVLGGITFDGVPALAGHSDGDVALHAVADALLGAAALGDLGRLFPADTSTPAGVDSRSLLAVVVERLAAAGWRPSSIDLIITAARPRLAARLEAMAVEIGEVLGLEPGRVSVKASTGNLEGSDGAGRTISALASATIEAHS